MQVQFFFEHNNIPLTNRTQLKKFIIQIFKAERKKLSHLNYIFCSDKRILKINQQYLNHNFYTDIITFTFSEPCQPIAGEIYISTDRVRENAGKHKVTIKQEIHRVIYHGTLHLCGYTDKTQKEKRIMTAMEDRYLNKYFQTTKFHRKHYDVPRGALK